MFKIRLTTALEMKFTTEEISAFLNGRDPMERIVNIECSYTDDKVSIIYVNKEGKKMIKTDYFKPFVWAKNSIAVRMFDGNREELKKRMAEYGISVKALKTNNGNEASSERLENGYKYMFYAKRPMSFQQFLMFFQMAKTPIYDTKKKKDINEKIISSREFLSISPVEQYMISTGKRFFKGYNNYDEVKRLQFDLETQGLNPEIHAIDQIGVRTNKGFEQIITVVGEVDENEELPVYENFVWASLGQIKELLTYPNVVNMDTRTVISCIQYGNYSEKDLQLLSVFRLDTNLGHSDSFLYSVLSSDNHYNTMNSIIRWLTSLKFKYELNVDKIGLSEMNNWIYDGNVIEHKDKKYFSVIGVDVSIGNREVTHWDQPMVKAAQEGIMGFLVKKINGIYHFLVQAKLECGNFDIVELAPTVQCLTGNYRNGQNEYSIPYIDNFLNADIKDIWYQAYQSEEGGRFFKEQNLNIIVEVHDDFSVEVEENYCWMTLNQMLCLVNYNNFLNIAARSLLSAVQFYK